MAGDNSPYVVSVIQNGEVVETILPKEDAQRLFRKLRTKGIRANIKREVKCVD